MAVGVVTGYVDSGAWWLVASFAVVFDETVGRGGKCKSRKILG